MHRQRCYITSRPPLPHHCCLINHVLFPRNLSRQAKKKTLCNLFLLLTNNRNASGVQAENKHLHLCHLKRELLPISLFLSTHLLLERLIVSISCSCALRQAKPQKIGYWRHWSLKKNMYFFEKCQSHYCCVICMCDQWWQYNSYLLHLLFPADTQL